MGGTFSPMGNNNLASLLHGPFSPFVSRLTRVDLFGPKSKIGCAEALCLAALYAVPGMGSFQLTIRGVSQRCLSLGTEGRAIGLCAQPRGAGRDKRTRPNRAGTATARREPPWQLFERN